MKGYFPNSPHFAALCRVDRLLRQHGVKHLQWMPHTDSPFDLLVDNKTRVEVKVSHTLQYLYKRNRLGVWRFNLHRHGVIARGAADFFVFVIPPIKALGMAYYIYLVVPAKEVEGKYDVGISPRSLLLKWGRYAGRWQDIKLFSA